MRVYRRSMGPLSGAQLMLGIGKLTLAAAIPVVLIWLVLHGDRVGRGVLFVLRKVGLVRPAAAPQPSREPLERIAADLLQVTITPASRLHGVEVGELRLPTGASVSMLIREGQSLVPERRTVLKRGDDMLVVTPRRLREATERRLREVSIGGRLAQWLPDE